jgi:tRNA-uridine 2-sulfurtransferase
VRDLMSDTDKIRCVGLLSGGLDSILATKLMMDLGLEVHCINFRSPFCTCTSHNMACSAAELAMRQLGDGVTLEVQEVLDDYLELIKHPHRQVGRGLNACLDCRAFKFRRAWDYAQSIGARFLFTGEVLGQRPMSQHRRSIDIIDRDADLVGKVLRPLSAQHFPETEAELEGWVDRDKLLDLSGRTRRPQIALAAEWGIDEYPCPAGGCLLTDKGFSSRLRDLFDHHPDCTPADVQVLKLGRHFRTPDGGKLVVARNDGENRRLTALAPAGTLAHLVEIPGPLVLVQDLPSDAGRGALVQLAGDGALAHASSPVDGPLTVQHWSEDGIVHESSYEPSVARAELRDSLSAWRL